MAKDPESAPPAKVATEILLNVPDFLGPAPLIPGEDPAAYSALQVGVSAAVRPNGVLEEIWVRDVIDLTWEARRLRRLKAQLLQAAAHEGLRKVLEPLIKRDFTSIGDDAARELSDRWARREPKAVKEVNGHLSAAGLTMDAVMAQTLDCKLYSIEQLDRMLASSEARRGAALREIDRHRETLASALRREAETEDAVFAEIGVAKASAPAQ
jgi:hypothetical protein